MSIPSGVIRGLCEGLPVLLSTGSTLSSKEAAALEALERVLTLAEADPVAARDFRPFAALVQEVDPRTCLNRVEVQRLQARAAHFLAVEASPAPKEG